MEEEKKEEEEEKKEKQEEGRGGAYDVIHEVPLKGNDLRLGTEATTIGSSYSVVSQHRKGGQVNEEEEARYIVMLTCERSGRQVGMFYYCKLAF